MQEVVENIALDKLKPFPNHPFKIREDEAIFNSTAFSTSIIPAAIPSTMLTTTAHTVGITAVMIPRRSSSFAPAKVNGFPAASSFLKAMFRIFCKCPVP